jgi:hypothetical protein
VRIAAAVALLLLVSGSASGQLGGRHPPRRTIAGGFGACEASGGIGPRLQVATDGLTATDCTAGEGVTAALCWCDGSAWVPLLSAGGDVSSVFTRTGAVVAEAGDYDAALINYTPADGTDWTDPDPTTVEQAGDDLAARVTDDEAALSSHAGNTDAHHARDHAAAHALGGLDALTVTTLASPCTDAQVLGGTAAGTGVECQAAGGGVGGSTGATDNALLLADGTGGALLKSAGADLVFSDTANRLMCTGDVSNPPRIQLNRSSAGAGLKKWEIYNEGGSSAALLVFGLLNDAETAWTRQNMLRLRVDGTGDYLDLGSNSTGPTRLRRGCQNTAPTTCAIGDDYSDCSGALCFCSVTNTWEQVNAVGSCV